MKAVMRVSTPFLSFVIESRRASEQRRDYAQLTPRAPAPSVRISGWSGVVGQSSEHSSWHHAKSKHSRETPAAAASKDSNLTQLGWKGSKYAFYNRWRRLPEDALPRALWAKMRWFIEEQRRYVLCKGCYCESAESQRVPSLFFPIHSLVRLFRCHRLRNSLITNGRPTDRPATAGPGQEEAARL